ncbi:MAG: hypothetical protein AB7V39_21665, partial [Nitrospiraceae bacterium]
FGTGLKYAVAVLVRHNIRVQLFIGTTEYEFVKQPGNFRGQDFDFLILRKRKGFTKKWTATQLPFTTEFGKNWQLWQAYRELYTNTVDEGGIVEDASNINAILPDPNQTRIVIKDARFADVHHNRREIFLLDEKGNIRSQGTGCEILPTPSKNIYWRGMKIYELPEKTPALYTYNIFDHIQLTEDRTAAFFQYDVMYKLADAVKASTNTQLIHNVVTCKQGHIEAEFPFEKSYGFATQQFKDVVNKVHMRSPSRLSSYAGGYYRAYLAPEKQGAAIKAYNQKQLDLVTRMIITIEAGNYDDLETAIEGDRTGAIEALAFVRNHYESELSSEVVF